MLFCHVPNEVRYANSYRSNSILIKMHSFNPVVNLTKAYLNTTTQQIISIISKGKILIKSFIHNHIKRTCGPSHCQPSPRAHAHPRYQHIAQGVFSPVGVVITTRHVCGWCSEIVIIRILSEIKIRVFYVYVFVHETTYISPYTCFDVITCFNCNKMKRKRTIAEVKLINRINFS